MKKKWIASVFVAVIVLIGIMRASFVVARSALQDDIVKQSVPDFVASKAFLSREPNTGKRCWTFAQVSWHDARTVHVSLFGKPMSFGTMKWMEPEQANAAYRR